MKQTLPRFGRFFFAYSLHILTPINSQLSPASALYETKSEEQAKGEAGDTHLLLILLLICLIRLFYLFICARE